MGRPPADPSKRRHGNPDYTVTGLRIKKTVHKRLKVYAINTERQVSAIVEEAIEEYLKRHKAR